MKNIILALMMFAASIAVADEKLATSKACMSCHKIDKKVVGPALKDIAAKKKDVAELKQSILKGSKGTWGIIPMGPQNVTEKEAETLSVWINTIK